MIPDPTDPIDLDALLRLAEEATPGPWEWGKHSPRDFDEAYREHMLVLYAPKANLPRAVLEMRHGNAALSDTAFIAACDPTTIAALVRRLRAAEERLATAEMVCRAAAIVDHMLPSSGPEFDVAWIALGNAYDKWRDYVRAQTAPPPPDDRTEP